MGCPDDNMLAAMVEQALEPAVFAELEIHIDSCEQCRKIIAAAAASRSLAVGTPALAVTESADLAKLEAIVDVSINGRYVIDSVLGRGGMGTVYLAKDVTLGREVALKLHRAGSGSGADRLQREAIAMAKLAHPNVVTVFEIATVEDRLYVAMEYVRGSTLRDWMAEHHTWRETIAMLVEVGNGLAAAHAAGLVHRDFKPENVLVGEDGRPRVGDFGLARVANGAEPRTMESGERESAALHLDTPLTVSGTLLGTPIYMAPEQLAGDAVDARCDQFAFCVVAWECLFGKRPFDGSSIAALQLAIEQQELAQGIGDAPERVRRLLARGLAADPAERYADVPALLAALRAVAKPRTWLRVAVVGAGVIALGASGIAVASSVSTQRHAAACNSEVEATRGVFGADARAVIKREFLATGLPYAQSSFDHATSVLARYADVLANQEGAVCRGRDEPARMTAARRACLADRKTELAGLVEVLAHADAGAVQRASSSAWAIFDPIPCDDAHTLLADPGASSPTSVEQAAQLSRVKALQDAARFQEALALATPLLESARARGDRNLELETLLQLGQILDETDPPAAAPLFHQAEALAEALGRDLDAAVVLTALANISGMVDHDYASAHRSIDLAHAKLERLGDGNLASRGALLMTEAQVLLDENRLGESETTQRHAVAVLEQAYGADHPKLGAAIATLSQLLRAEGKQAESLEASQRALDILRAALGDDHPTVAGAEMNLATSLISAERFDEARALLLQADGVFARVFGANHPTRAAVYGNLGALERMQEHWDAALVAYRTALGILERTEGADSVAASSAHTDVARTLALQQHLDAAVAEQQRAIAILEKLGADGEPRLVTALSDLAEYELALERPAVALPIAERSLALALRRPDDANREDVADARFAVAEALWETHGDRTRARTLAKQARPAESDPARIKPIDDWLGTH